MPEKRPINDILNKLVVTKEGKKIGIVRDLTFETRTGELIHLVLGEPTAYSNTLNLERGKDKEVLLPYSAVIAIGDFVVVAEEDLV